LIRRYRSLFEARASWHSKVEWVGSSSSAQREELERLVKDCAGNNSNYARCIPGGTPTDMAVRQALNPGQPELRTETLRRSTWPALGQVVSGLESFDTRALPFQCLSQPAKR
jgi:hypothetical protein